MKLFPDNPIEEIYGIKDMLKPAPVGEQAINNYENIGEIPEYSLEEAERGLAFLKEEVSRCNNCRLAPTRNNIVFGEGNPKARLMFIGEGPGADEDASGRPFVGRAGQLLTKMIEAMGYSREEIYIANIVKCRPPGNRDPFYEEAMACIGYLKKQIEFIRPKVIVCLGSVATNHLFDEKIKITSARGSWRDFHGCKVMLTYHPSFLLRSPSKKKDVWMDLQEVMKVLA